MTADKVRTSLWPSRRPEIKALLADADEQGRFDKQELLAHIANNALGRPILFTTDARSVGTACKNALAKERRETAAVKKTADAAVTAARAAAAKDASLLGTVAAAEAARKTALAAVLEQVYDLKLPNSRRLAGSESWHQRSRWLPVWCGQSVLCVRQRRR